MNSFRPAILTLAAAVGLTTPLAFAQSNPYRGLWVGDVLLGAVNEVTTPLDANNVPRSPDPTVTTPTKDTASLRLIIHVDAGGRATLLKSVAILARKAGVQETENDLALVTNERLYGAFPAQPASRISSIAFDFGDQRATAAVDQIVNTASQAAAVAASKPNATIESIKAAVLAAINPLVAPADATSRFSAFLQGSLNAQQVKAIAAGGPSSAAATTAKTAAEALRDGSSFKDTRGVDMLQAILAGLASAGNASAAEKEKIALGIAASYAETDDAYERYLAGEIMGNMIAAASRVAADSASKQPLKTISSFSTTDNGAAVLVQSTAHGLSSNDEIAIIDAPVSRYNGLQIITRLSADTFKISTPYAAGGAIGGYSGSTEIAPLVVVSAGHGLGGDTRITVRGSQTGYNGSFIATPLGPDSFSIPLAYAGDPSVKGTWSTRTSAITAYAATADGTSGIRITSPGHGLNNGQTIEIFGSSTPSYNGRKTVTRIDDNSFSINQPFVENSATKGSWDLPVGITRFSPPSVTPTLITANAHGLKTGDRIVISGAGYTPYNAGHVVTVVSANSFSIPVIFDPAAGVPAAKGSWTANGTGSWRKAGPIRSAVSADAAVVAAETEAARIRIAAYDDTRAVDATRQVINAIIASAATNKGVLTGPVGDEAAVAAREVLASVVRRYPSPTVVPSADYDSFVRSSAFSSATNLAADAVAAAAFAEKRNLISTPASIADKAKASAITALTPIYSEASRTLLSALPMTGTFSTGSSGLTAEINLPATHPTNPFRHRRHPDHTVGFDIRRVVNLSFDAAEGSGPARAGYGVDRITGVYDEEIFGLHKPLGPSKNVGLKVRGLFKLNRISLIDTLNGK